MESTTSQRQSPTGTSSVVHGSKDRLLSDMRVGPLLEAQAKKHADRDLIISWTGNRLTYADLFEKSKLVAKALLATGIDQGDRIGVFLENCEEFVEVFFGCCLVGATTVLLNHVYTPNECEKALSHTGCVYLFTSTHLGWRSIEEHVRYAHFAANLRDIIMIRPRTSQTQCTVYDDFLRRGERISWSSLEGISGNFSCHDVCTLQFTSGTTGRPKVAMSTHSNIINNAMAVGDKLLITERDVICCAPLLLHSFGLVLGMLLCVSRGAALVFASPTFDADAIARALVEERCTALHGVPAMFHAVLRVLAQDVGQYSAGSSPICLRTGIIGGDVVSRALMLEIRKTLGIPQLAIAYGMTEAGPCAFITDLDDDLELRLSTVGKVLPHLSAKVVDRAGRVQPFGVPGELCISGYCLQKGYFNDKQHTAEFMKEDEFGVRWMHTGDEAVINATGHCMITGRIKDIIIRGGEKIAPADVEERLMEHPAILQCVVVGAKDLIYGEVVTAFVEQRGDYPRPSINSLRTWTQNALGCHRQPTYVFWLGDEGIPTTLPLTENGKPCKRELRKILDKLVE